MIQNYLSTFFRVFKKNWLSSLINITGLSVGMVSALLIAKYIGYSLVFNSSYENRNRIFHVSQIETNDGNVTYDGSATYRGVAILAQREIPEVEAFTKFNWGVEYLISVENETGELKQFNQTGIFSADTAFTDIFNLQPLAGNLEKALDEPASVIINRSIAEKYFGSIDVIGRTIKGRVSWGAETNWTVACVVEDLPRSASRRFNILVSGHEDLTNLWENAEYNQFVLLREGKDAELVAEKITRAVNALPMFQDENRSIVITLDPIKPELSKFELFLISTGILIMVLSWISFTNLSIVQFMQRQREMFIRRSIGADNSGLVKQFLVETGGVVMIALAISLVLLYFVKDYFQGLTDGHLLPLLGDEYFLNTLFIVVFIIGALLPSGYVMSTFLIRHKTTLQESKQARFNAGARRRKVLAGLQFGIAIMMITFTYVIDLQMDFLSGMSKGVNLENKLIIKPPKDVWQGKGRRARALSNELSQLSWVNHVSSSTTIPGQAYRQEVNYHIQGTENEVLMYVNNINPQFLPAYEIEVLAGENFPSQGGPSNRSKVLINLVSMKALGLELSNAIGQKIVDEEQETYTIIGVVLDYHKTSPKEKIGPMIFRFNAVRGYFTVNFNEENPPTEQSYAELESIWRDIYAEMPFEYFLLSSYYDYQFGQEDQLLGVMRVFTFVAIFLACFSLIGLSIFEMANSKLEVGVRKTFGASSLIIGSHLLKRYLTLFVVAILVVLPVIYYLTGQWLNDFSYRIQVTPLHILVPAAGLLFISFSSIAIQIFKLSRVNPVKVLREG
ncbi:MAG: ABC transporter permease [Cytophagales bacterium]|nr:ABC transporter permease [Cytophagales bacterium]